MGSYIGDKLVTRLVEDITAGIVLILHVDWLHDVVLHHCTTGQVDFALRWWFTHWSHVFQ